jgi:hypothetical protein
MRSVPLAIVAFLVVAIGCHAHRTEPVGHGESEPAVLNFLQDGATTRNAVRERLGEPSGRFEDNRILTYRLNTRYEVVPGTLYPGSTSTEWRKERYSLVLIFGDDGVLERHRLIRIR